MPMKLDLDLDAPSSDEDKACASSLADDTLRMVNYSTRATALVRKEERGDASCSVAPASAAPAMVPFAGAGGGNSDGRASEPARVVRVQGLQPRPRRTSAEVSGAAWHPARDERPAPQDAIVVLCDWFPQMRAARDPLDDR